MYIIEIGDITAKFRLGLDRAEVIIRIMLIFVCLVLIHRNAGVADNVTGKLPA